MSPVYLAESEGFVLSVTRTGDQEKGRALGRGSLWLPLTTNGRGPSGGCSNGPGRRRPDQHWGGVRGLERGPMGAWVQIGQDRRHAGR